MIEKPPYTTPCNHCGLCCRLEVCPGGRMLTNEPAPCVFIVLDGEKHLCGLVLMEQAVTPNKPYLATKLAIGYGCTMSDDSTTRETRIDFLDRTSAYIQRLERNIIRRPYGKPSTTIHPLPWNP